MTSVSTDWMTIAEACQYLRITRSTLYRWAREGRLRLYRMGSRTTRVKRPDLERMASTEGTDSWAALSEPAFDSDWDNEKDAAYDDWRKAYGVPDR